MKIVVFNVKYSENLGDGLLAQCVEAGLTKEGGHIEVETIDLAGREGFGTSGGSGRRQQALKVLHRLPGFARRWAVGYVLGRSLRKLRGRWDAKIAAADAVVIGGGNLFQDDDLNFPLKVGTVLDSVRRHNRPLAIYAVGVSGHWSAPAARLFGRLKQTNLVHLSVRDSFAQDSWRRHFPNGPEAKIVHDPGLLARTLVSDDCSPASPKRRPIIGLCVTEPVILQRHASQKASAIPLQDIAEYRDLIRLLVQDGYRVCLFCNGASEDQIFAQRIMDEVLMHRLALSGALQLAPRPRAPEELIRILRSANVILAHRLHACIAAYSLGIPHVGLGWDKKVEGFFRSVGRQSYFLNGSGTSVSDIARLLRAADSEGIESHHHRVIMAEAEAGIADMRRNLTRRDQNIAAEMSSVIRNDHRAAASN
ncbi:polysaccharide pyruvyl transferase family protein (plasmid) [Rhizobium sp. CB3171]|uniref:polysaccharide pyruvyl transferase family protein n=1 Tax=Rhizobium sp. CB3171 TaxID=3039157 RepID=UPI0024B05FE1|nr:polysaccharide pyruvyl transferase family protein [Rhizobium sp. CB3171]WFU06431.1 polysaccharide pyruvyl transferase family protein [Rhizobium sp. CB3171]